MPRRLSIQLNGDLADATAEALGCWVVREQGVWLTTDYVDQPQLTGLLVRLGDLHIAFETVAIEDEPDVAAIQLSEHPQGEMQ